jgi:two-component system NtrC family sensor kinase
MKIRKRSEARSKSSREGAPKTNRTPRSPKTPDMDQITNENRLEAIGRLTAGIAHELNNPLSVILGFAQSLVSHAKEEDPTTDTYKTIEREALRCKRVVENLLTFSRQPQSQKKLEDLNAILQDTLSIINPKIWTGQVEIVCKSIKDLPLISVDRHEIQQLVVNLCINALDAMPQGGTLSLTLARTIMPGDQAAIELRIQDTGTGIPSDIQNRIFEPFYTTKSAGKGTGLGLNIVQNIVKGHGGTIRVQSKVGEGTTFIVQLPLDPGKSVSPKKAQTSRPPTPHN